MGAASLGHIGGHLGVEVAGLKRNARINLGSNEFEPLKHEGLNLRVPDLDLRVLFVGAIEVKSANEFDLQLARGVVPFLGVGS